MTKIPLRGDTIASRKGFVLRGADLREGSPTAYGIPVWHIAVLAALMLIQVICVTLASTGSSDTNRDVFFAQQIAAGQYFPLVGPVINSMLHLGPLWYYVLAMAVWLVPNAAAAMACMGVISALQFPLAYRLGLRFGSARESLLFALALATPGYMDVSVVSLTHVIAVVPCLLFGVLAALAYRERPDVPRAAAAGIACALLFQAHPTTLLFVGLLALYCLSNSPDWATRILHGLFFAVLFILPFVPALYVQWRDGFPDVATATSYAKGEWSSPSFLKALELDRAILMNGPKYITRFWLEEPPKVERWLFALYVLMLLVAAVGLVLRCLREPAKRRLIAALLGLLIVQSMFVCSLRKSMPPWMIYVQWPLFAALFALGWEWACVARVWSRRAVGAGVALLTVWSASVWAYFAVPQLDLTEIKASPGKNGLMDVRDYEKPISSYRVTRIPFYQVFALGRELCHPVTLYGHYAYLFDITHGAGAMQLCGGADGIEMGGMPQVGREAVLGLHTQAWEILAMKPARRLDTLGLAVPTAVWQSTTPLHWDLPLYLNRPHRLVGTSRRFVVDGDTSGDQAVLVTHRAHRYLEYKLISVSVDGWDVSPAYEDITTVIFRSPWRQKKSVHWHIEAEGNPNYVDVLTFGSSG